MNGNRVSKAGLRILALCCPAAAGCPALHYFLLKQEWEGRPSFSILCQAEPSEVLWKAETYVPDVTSCEETGRMLLKALCQGRVTPYGLREAISEWLGSGGFAD